ncbi:MAG: response regulator [Gammaproteobacteria bacterium]|nr:response regulator [Gammaproteobacteria bacterium]
MSFIKQQQNLNINEIANGVVYLILAWSICIITSLSWNIYQTYQQSYKRAESTALSDFNRDQAFRNWISDHNGIYIRSQVEKPSFNDAGINTIESYILLDPATFLNQVMSDYPDRFDSSIRMIGIKPFNLNNLPTSWENNVINLFKKGETEFLDYDLTDDSHHLGLFKPMYAASSCLTCHKKQGFEQGDLMGAAGVYIDINPFLNSAKELSQILIISHLLIWIIGYIATVLYGRKTELRVKGHLHLEKQLKQAYEQLEQRVEQRTIELSKLSKAVENSPVMVVISDNNGLIEYVNPRFTEISGYNFHDVIGKNPSLMKSSRTPKKVHEDLWKTISSGKLWSGELCNRRKDGKEFWVSASIAPIFSDAGQITNYISVEEDISEKKSIEKNLILAKNTAEEANKAKSEFLASMSHELRTPLNAIIGFSQLSQLDKSVSEQQKKNSEETYKAGKHLLGLIDDILDLTSIEIGKVKLNLQPITLKKMIKECYELIYPMAKEKNISLDFSNYECSCMVQADYIRLKQIILNVLSNAVKYTKLSGSIKLHCYDGKHDDIVIEVIDTGDGISHENMKNLFEPFNRLGKEKSAIEGTGIGLVISKKFIEMIGGEILVESIVDQGSTFSIILPKTNKKSIPEVIKTDLIHHTADLKNLNLNIFYIEDNPANLKLMENIINLQKGWNFSYAKTAEEGIELIKRNNPDLILMDINLPGMDGIEACHHIKSIKELTHIPIIAISAGAMKENLEKAMDADFIDYITKPVDVKILIQKIDKLYSKNLMTKKVCKIFE